MTAFNPKPATDLEVYELMVAAFPDRFQEGEDDIWDDIMSFVDEQFGDFDALADLLGRLVLLTHPMESALTNKHAHCMGPVEIKDGKVFMMAAIQRLVDTTNNTQGEAATHG
ncbi:hypothetical protein ACK3ZP_20910 [Aeromonas caviae]